MEQFLQLDRELAEQAIAQYQDSPDPRMRHRIHQMIAIMGRRRARADFIQAVRKEDMTLWDGVVQINALYDLHCRVDEVEERIAACRKELGPGRITTARIAACMRDCELLVPREDVLDIDLFLIERVLATGYGCPAILCALAQHIGAARGWNPTIVLYDGRFCLCDAHDFVINPSENWHVEKLAESDRIHPCARKNVWLGILTQLFLVSLVDGNLRDLYHFGDLLTALNDDSLDTLPYPLGTSRP